MNHRHNCVSTPEAVNNLWHYMEPKVGLVCCRHCTHMDVYKEELAWATDQWPCVINNM